MVPGIPHYGVAIDQNGITVVTGGGFDALHLPLVRPIAPVMDGEKWTALEEALSELHPNLHCRLSIALLAPYSRVMRVVLPTHRPADQRIILQRSASRFFATMRGPVIVDALPLSNRLYGNRHAAVLAGAAEEEMVERVLAAAGAAGFQVENITTGACAVVQGVVGRHPPLGRRHVVLGAVTESAVQALFLRAGQLQLLRSIPRDVLEREVGAEPPADSSVTEEWLDRVIKEGRVYHGLRVDRVALLSPLSPNGELAGSLGLPGSFVYEVPCGETLNERQLAAEGARWMGQPRLQLLPERFRRRSKAAERRRVGAKVLIGLVCLVSAAFLHLAAVRGQLQAVEEHRRVLRPAVEEILRMRSTLTGVDDRLEPLSREQRESTGWLAVLAAVTDVLPRDGHLLALQGDSGHLKLEIRARSAAEMIAEFDSSPLFSDVEVIAPIRRDLFDGHSYERISLRVTPTRAGSGGLLNGRIAGQTKASDRRDVSLPDSRLQKRNER